MARLRIVVVLVSVTVVSACSTPSSPDSQPRDSVLPPSATASALVELTNVERAGAGLAALRASAGLMEAAQIQAEQIAAAGRLEHTLPDARFPRLEDRLAAAGYSWQAAGENLAFGQRTAALAVDTWMQSSTHRANILNAAFTELGTGHVVDPNGRRYHVQVFARPR